MVLRLLELLEEIVFPSVAGEGAVGASCGGFALFLIMTAASAAAFFCASRAAFVLSATILPAATRFGFFAGRVVGVGEVTCCVMSAAGVSSGCCSVDVMLCNIILNFNFNLEITRCVLAQQLLSIAQ